MIVFKDDRDLSSHSITLDAGEVHAWRVALDRAHSMAESFLEILEPDERQRAGRYYRSVDRDRFIVARGMLRTILSRYVGLPPDRLRFSYTSYGKPSLIEAQTLDGLRFNLSHSHEMALIAVTRGCEIGVDIEFIREDLASLEIAERFFSEREIAALRSLEADLQTLAFFNCWTRKEAYIKALGEGLSHPLNKFAVSLEPGRPAAMLAADNDPLAVSRWRLYDLDVPPGYVAALAVESRPSVSTERGIR